MLELRNLSASALHNAISEVKVTIEEAKRFLEQRLAISPTITFRMKASSWS